MGAGDRVLYVVAFIRFLLGEIVCTCGVIVAAKSFTEQDCVDSSLEAKLRRIDRIDGQFWSIWIGVVIIVTEIVGMSTFKRNTAISCYMALLIVSSVASAVGIIPISISLADCNSVRLVLTDGVNILSYYDYYYHDSYSIDTYRERMNVYNEMDEYREKQRDCLREIAHTAKSHFSCYCFILPILVVECVLIVIPIIFFCVGNDCCKRAQPTQLVVWSRVRVSTFKFRVRTFGYQDLDRVTESES